MKFINPSRISVSIENYRDDKDIVSGVVALSSDVTGRVVGSFSRYSSTEMTAFKN